MTVYHEAIIVSHPVDYPRKIGEDDSAVIDITDQVQAAVSWSGIANGFVIVQSMHTTCGITVNELQEGGLRRDLNHAVQHLIPYNEHAEHHRFDTRDPDTMHPSGNEMQDGHAHLRTMNFTSVSAVLIINDRIVHLGKWQRIFLVDMHPWRFVEHQNDYGSTRSIAVLVMGE